MSSAETIRVKIKRQDRQDSAPYWDEFDVPYSPNMNVITLLQEIQRNPVNASGKKVAPVAWDCCCLEEVCGACTMVINGTVRQACSALVDQLEKPIVLEPMRKFPVVRDLFVDRSRMFEALKRLHAWVEIDGTHDLGPGLGLVVPLPGVGLVRAAAIVAYRENFVETGEGAVAFESPEDLQKVKGIGPKTAEGMKKLLKFERKDG